MPGLALALSLHRFQRIHNFEPQLAHQRAHRNSSASTNALNRSIRYKECEDYDMDIMIQNLGIGMALWSDCLEHTVLLAGLRKMVASNAAQVTNIVCIGHGNLGFGFASIMQHIVASSIAEDLTSLYKEYGQRLPTPITIIAQDPAYSANDKTLLSRFPTPIRVVADPEGFLGINESSFVMSCYPSAPVKQMVADLAADFASGKGPAAVLMNDAS
jgi:hypothetical protein